jgi:hypothetical protein
MKIIFTNFLDVPEKFSPKPADKNIPSWYKNLNSYINNLKKPNGHGPTPATAKRCMPIFDSMTSGYIIFTHADLHISQVKDEESGLTNPYYQWSGYDAISFHTKSQLPEYPDAEGHEFAYPKWINAWGIKTPKGYSCLFMPPMHRDTPIKIIPGIVDTDKYTAMVNFPFLLKDSTMEGMIPAGTPIAQVVPFKRDNWKMQFGGIKEKKDVERQSSELFTLFFDKYKTLWWQRKDYS